MKVIFIKNYKMKSLACTLLIFLWVSMSYLANFLQYNAMFLKVSIENELDFSYPMNLKIEKIYSNIESDAAAVTATTIFSNPLKGKFSKVNALSNTLSFSFPSAFTINEQNFTGSDILYHVDFNNTSKDVHGFVQVWNIQSPLNEFLEMSKSSAQQNYTNFKMYPININGVAGYQWDYIAKSDSQSVKAMEVFLEKDNKMYRISYFIPTKNWDKKQSKIFNNIIKSVKIK